MKDLGAFHLANLKSSINVSTILHSSFIRGDKCCSCRKTAQAFPCRSFFSPRNPVEAPGFPQDFDWQDPGGVPLEKAWAGFLPCRNTGQGNPAERPWTVFPCSIPVQGFSGQVWTYTCIVYSNFDTPANNDCVQSLKQNRFWTWAVIRFVM